LFHGVEQRVVHFGPLEAVFLDDGDLFAPSRRHHLEDAILDVGVANHAVEEAHGLR